MLRGRTNLSGWWTCFSPTDIYRDPKFTPSESMNVEGHFGAGFDGPFWRFLHFGDNREVRAKHPCKLNLGKFSA